MMTKSDKPISTIGFISLGVMGSRMCRNLAEKSQATVLAYDIDRSKLCALDQHGVVQAAPIEEVAAESSILFLCLPGEPQVREIFFRQCGLIECAKPGQIFVDMSTTTVEIARQIGGELSQKGANFADAPDAVGETVDMRL